MVILQSTARSVALRFSMRTAMTRRSRSTTSTPTLTVGMLAFFAPVPEQPADAKNNAVISRNHLRPRVPARNRKVW